MRRRAAAVVAAMVLAIGCKREVHEDALERLDLARPLEGMQALGGSPRGLGLPHSDARSVACVQAEGRWFSNRRDENRLWGADVGVDGDVDLDVAGHDPVAALEACGDLGGALESAWALDDLGLALLLAGRPTRALVPLERAAILDGDQPIFWNDLGLAYEAQGRLAEARGALERAAALDPGRSPVVENLARVRAADLAQAAAREADARQGEGGAGGAADREGEARAREKSAGDDLAGADLLLRGEPQPPLDRGEAGEADCL